MKTIRAKVSPIEKPGYIQTITVQGETDRDGLFYGEVIVCSHCNGEFKVLNMQEIYVIHKEIIANIWHLHEVSRELYDSEKWKLWELDKAFQTLTKTKTSWVRDHPIQPAVPSAPPLEDVQDLPPSYDEAVQDTMDVYLN